MRLFLIRHADAGTRSVSGGDIGRTLSPKGHARAADLATMLRGAGISTVLSSPATRCVQTVEPLAAALGLEVEVQPDLWEGTSADHVLTLLEHSADANVAACSHGDIIPDVVNTLARRGALIQGRGCRKGSVWILDHDGEQWTHAHYVDRSDLHLPDQAAATGDRHHTAPGD